jgi:hypothetical protein
MLKAIILSDIDLSRQGERSVSCDSVVAEFSRTVDLFINIAYEKPVLVSFFILLSPFSQLHTVFCADCYTALAFYAEMVNLGRLDRF